MRGVKTNEVIRAVITIVMNKQSFLCRYEKGGVNSKVAVASKREGMRNQSCHCQNEAGYA